jgi:hypothetical protein
LGLAYGLTWVDLHHQLNNSPHLQAQFKKAGKWLSWSILVAGSTFAAPFLLNHKLYDKTPHDLDWAVVVSGGLFLIAAIFFIVSLTSLIHDAKGEAAKTRT